MKGKVNTFINKRFEKLQKKFESWALQHAVDRQGDRQRQTERLIRQSGRQRYLGRQDRQTDTDL